MGRKGRGGRGNKHTRFKTCGAAHDMKSYALYRMMTFLMTFTDPYPGFQGHGIFYVEYLKNFFAPWLTDKLLLNSNRKPYMVYRMVPFSMTLSDL